MNCYGQTIYLYQRARFQNNYKSSINKQSSRLIKQPQYTRTLFSSSSIILVRTSILHLFYIGLSLILVFALFSLFRFIVSTSILHHLLFVRRKKRGESDLYEAHFGFTSYKSGQNTKKSPCIFQNFLDRPLSLYCMQLSAFFV